MKLFRWARKGALWIVLFFYLPLILLAESQSLASLYESGGAKSIHPLSVWSSMRGNMKMIWFKTIGVYPRLSLLPWLGANFVVEESTSALRKWGGCAIPMRQEEDAAYALAFGFARCAPIADLKINDAFAQLPAAQLEYAYQAMEATRGVKDSMSELVAMAYAIMAMADEKGPFSVSEFIGSHCVRAFKGESNDRTFCLVALELEEALAQVDVNDENERRAVAIKTGIQSWMWMATDEGLAQSFWRGAASSGMSPTSIASLRRWGSSYTPYKDKKASMRLLTRRWAAADFAQVDAILRRGSLNRIDERIWAQEFNVRH